MILAQSDSNCCQFQPRNLVGYKLYKIQIHSPSVIQDLSDFATFEWFATLYWGPAFQFVDFKFELET